MCMDDEKGIPTHLIVEGVNDTLKVCRYIMSLCLYIYGEQFKAH